MVFGDLNARCVESLRLLDTAKLRPGLVVMRRKAKSKPRASVMPRVPASLTYLSQHVVVALGIAAEILLDA